MLSMRILLLSALGLTAAACTTAELPSRAAPFEQLPETAVSAPAGYQATEQAVARISTQPATVAIPAGRSPVTVNKIVVQVPKTLTVSEANLYLPKGDIVWREDPRGDRYEQVKVILETAMARGVNALDGPVSADLHIRLIRFHALTEKARYTTGGVHAITFDLALVDPKTGQNLLPSRRVRADLKAYGGQRAIEAEARGLTQKVRITAHLAAVIQEELTNPEGYKNANLGIIQALHGV